MINTQLYLSGNEDGEPHYKKIFRLLTIYSLIFLAVICWYKANAQTIVGRQQAIKLPISGGTDSTNALLWLPRDYDTSSNSYPLIIFLHGTGQTGASIASLSKLNTGYTLPYRIANGNNMEFVNPIDKKLYKFIVVSPQAPSWSYQYMHIKYMLPALIKKYRVDTSRIYVTGFSAGGYGVWTCVTDDTSFMKKLAAIVPVSPAPIETYRTPGILNAAHPGIPIWDICGTADGFYSPNVAFIDSIDAHTPVTKPDTTWLSGVGHSAWNEAYDSSWKVGGMNVYEWMLQYTRATMLSVPTIDTTSSFGTVVTTHPIADSLRDSSEVDTPITVVTIPTPPKVVLPALSTITSGLGFRICQDSLIFTDKTGATQLQIIFSGTLNIYNKYNSFTTPTNITTTTYGKKP